MYGFRPFASEPYGVALSVAPTGTRIVFSGVPSAEAFGSFSLQPDINFSGIPSAEAFGSFIVDAVGDIYFSGVPSAEAFGSFSLQLDINFSGVPSAEAFGSFSLQPDINFSGVPSVEAFGSFNLQPDINFSGVPSAEAFGSFVVDAVGDIYFSGVPSAEAFGSFTAIWQNDTPIVFNTPGRVKKKKNLPEALPVSLISIQPPEFKHISLETVSKDPVPISRQFTPGKRTARKARAADIEASDIAFILAVLDESI